MKIWSRSPYHLTNTYCATRKIVSEYDQEIPQSQTADNPMAPQGTIYKSWLEFIVQFER